MVSALCTNGMKTVSFLLCSQHDLPCIYMWSEMEKNTFMPLKRIHSKGLSLVYIVFNVNLISTFRHPPVTESFQDLLVSPMSLAKPVWTLTALTGLVSHFQEVPASPLLELL